MSYEIEYRSKLQCSETAAADMGWRGRLAHRLRQLAARLDGDLSLRLRVETLPCLERHDVARCVERGLEHANSLLTDACRAEALEGVLRAECSELYDDEVGSE
ncbi:hypothetical protein [Halomonas getboli]|uniref:hypothetical protein n=1 Tax=Halomonas getboli TaxID=2935862 RepID=UPI0020000B18|nr:hypothetical protein [Halomonas getboli]MCK2183530.1 hypothetical protein [Halomonas getboli]